MLLLGCRKKSVISMENENGESTELKAKWDSGVSGALA